MSGTMPGRSGSELALRLVSGVVLVAVAVAALWAGGWVFAALAALGAVLILREWMAMSGPFEMRATPWAVLALSGASALMARQDPLQAAGFLVIVAVALQMARVTEPRVGWLSTGLLYAGVPAVAAVALRGDSEFTFTSVEAVAVIFVFVVVWATDSAAYFTGRLIGGPKLAPRFSPKKTWSGAIGGVTAAVIAGLAVVSLAGFAIDIELALVAALLSVTGQIGDLGESAMKRHFGVKDSGALIPGHGGVMDRLDGLVFALTLAAAIGLAHDWLSGGGIAAGLITW